MNQQSNLQINSSPRAKFMNCNHIFHPIAIGLLSITPAQATQEIINKKQITPQATKSTRIVLDLRTREVKVLFGRRQLGPWPVAIGAPETPTPHGEFRIIQKVINPIYTATRQGRKIRYLPGPTSPIGDRYLEFHRNRRGVFAIHGTNWPNWVRSRAAVSNGCIRMLNQDIRHLFDAVNIGTPLEIRN